MDHMESVVDCKVVVVCEQCKECLCITQLTNTVGCIFDLNVFYLRGHLCGGYQIILFIIILVTEMIKGYRCVFKVLLPPKVGFISACIIL